MTLTWEERFQCFLRRSLGRDRSSAWAKRLDAALPPGYRELTPPVLAGRDALHLLKVAETGAHAFELWPPDGDRHQLRLYSPKPRFLDELLPFLAHLGLRVAGHLQFSLSFPGESLLINSFSVQPAQAEALPLSIVKKNLLAALGDALAGRLESDGLNGLLPLTGLSAWAIDVFRGYRNYALQLGWRFSPASFEQALLRNPGTAALLHRYFEARFNPEVAAGEEALDLLRLDIAAALDKVLDSADDRILRRLFNLIDATLRTSYFHRRGREGYFLALKIGSLGVLDMPAPSPLFEIYVHAAHTEGIHLRGAKVARGGIRWSDRPDDFRAEILGLQQTQSIKNAQIVPHGAKGGFIVKTPCASRSECLPLANAAYDTLMRGLLDLTDNITETGVTRPGGLLAYDGDDPYLVVAADKGTAHLSDAANAVSAEYGFWLGDAFASGGSRGYDHKRLGITARGAWECVKRHFQDLGRDMRQPFTVVGVGSMDGDVFGNGLLYSDAIRLKAAFGAKHIFLDPDPKGAESLQERRRLFELPGSSWDDYDLSLVSPGGGVFERSAKDIPLSRAVRQWLGAHHASMDGEDLVRLLLTAPVDLLFLGGIGTYVKAGGETHEQVGDRANDAARVDGGQLRAKIVAEGANLGFTQKARVEFALSGGLINLDAVDNSAGVDLSDHEVNLKILLAGQERRDEWLRELTPEVCAAVLADNRAQSLCISLDRERCLLNAAPFLDVAQRLENAGLLDRAAESFPARQELSARPGKALTRPELAVLMLHSKLALKQALLEHPGFLDAFDITTSPLPPREKGAAPSENPCPQGLRPGCQSWLADYFPKALREPQAEAIQRHPLAREITATCLTNAVINQAGCGLLAWAGDFDADALAATVQAYLYYDGLFGGAALRAAIDAQQAKLPAASEYQLRLRLEAALAECCVWPLRHGKPLAAMAALDAAEVDGYLAFLARSLDAAGQAALQTERAERERQGFSPEAALKLGLLERLGDFPWLADLAAVANVPLDRAAQYQQSASECLELDGIDARLKQFSSRDAWERRVQHQLRERFRRQTARLARALLAAAPPSPEAFIQQRGGRAALEKLRQLRRQVDAAAPAILPYVALEAELDVLLGEIRFEP